MSENTEARLRVLAEQAAAAANQRGLSGLAAWTEYLAATRVTVNQFRALEAADLLYLDGMRLRHIAEALHIAHQSVAEWLERYGPSSYLTVGEVRGGYQLHRVKVTGLVETRRQLSALRDVGRRIAPARWEVGDAVDARQLWERLEGVTRQSPAPEEAA